jgi:hypothetical protein
MFRTGKQRFESSSAHSASRKRRKLEAGTKNSTKTNPQTGTSPTTLSADELPWREITPPKWLDDAEGFFGLEEIDDVDVVLDAKGKQTCFRVRWFFHSLLFHSSNKRFRLERYPPREFSARSSPYER